MKKYLKNPSQKLMLAASLKKSLPEKAFWFDENQIQQFKTASEIILTLAYVAGVVAVATIAPNALRLFKDVPALRKSLRKNNRPTQKIADTFYYLKRQGYVKLVPKGSDIFVELTQAGQKRILQMNFNNPVISKTQKWDGKWWLALADIPTKEYRNQADSLRRKIRRLGLYPLQRTVWVYPFDPTEAIVFVAGRLQVDRFVTVLRADKIDEQDRKVLEEYFKGVGII